MWCTWRASPVSITRPACRRVPSRTRWWWTAATASNDGIGARSGPTARSDRMMMLMPRAIASCAWSQTSLSATSIASGPPAIGQLMQVVNKALEVRALRDENRKLKAELGRRYEFDNIIGRSGAMQEIFDTIERVAPTRSTVLLAGESGTGKDLIARAIHFHSPRRDRPLVKINCTAIPENLMESELFGYEKGAFTGAMNTKPGKFEQADTGTPVALPDSTFGRSGAAL